MNFWLVLVFGLSILFLFSLVWQLYRWTILSSPTSYAILLAMESRLKKYVDPGSSTVADLGSGFGTTLLFFHQKQWSQLIGVEGFMPAWAISCILKTLLGLSNLRLERGDYRKKEIVATVLLIYTSPRDMKKTAQWLEKNVVSYEWIVTHTFSLPGYKPYEITYASDMYNSPIYIYKNPHKADQPIA